MYRNDSFGATGDRVNLDGRWSRCLQLLLLLALAAAAEPAVADPPKGRWESPFQSGKPDVVGDRLQALPASRCDHDQFNKCTFSARVDYDGDGVDDTVRMVNGRRASALVVFFGGKRSRHPMTIASFKSPWTGSCYIEAARGDRRAVALTCPESSAATFKMRDGQPAVRWTGD